MSAEIDVLVGVAGLLVAAPGTRRQYQYNEAARYTSKTAFGFYIDIAPENDLPAITLADYTVADPTVPGDEIMGVQFRIVAADRRAVKEAVADIRAVIHGRWGGTLGSTKLISATRASGTNLGQDSRERLVRTENYHFTIYRP